MLKHYANVKQVFMRYTTLLFRHLLL